jgi:hypothetical protein
MIKKILLILPLIVLFSSCRKEVSEEVTSTETGVNTSYFIKPWRKISYPYLVKVRSFAIFNDQLYMAANDTYGFSEDSYVYNLKSVGYAGYTYPDTYTGGFEYIDELFEFNNFASPVGVSSMRTINNRLYIGGDFRYGNDYYDLIYLEADLSVHSVGFSHASFSSVMIHNIGEYNGDPIICGNFNATVNTEFFTSHVELIQNNAAVGMASLNGAAYDSEVFDGELYVVGQSDQIVTWNGSSWTAVNYIGKTITDKVYAVEIHNSELYFLGDFAGTSVLKKYSTSTGWSDVDGITSFSVPTYSTLKVLDNELFVVGRYFQSEGVEGSIWKLNALNQWRKFGDLTLQIRDLVKFKSKYYAAAEDGVYLY